MDLHLLEQDLQQQIAKRQAIVIVGTGVSVGATQMADAASWPGLLENGVARCEAVAIPRLEPSWAKDQREALKRGHLHDYLAVASQIEMLLGAPEGGEYRRWLHDAVGNFRAQDRSVLEALRDLRVPLATTNYDGLLEEVTGFERVTWDDAPRLQNVIHGRLDGIIHLHGYWEQPGSVVLGFQSYGRVIHDSYIQALQSAFALMKSLVFVGYGSGLADPNIGILLNWMSRVLWKTEQRHFRLCRTSESEAIQQQHSGEQRVFVVPYGPQHTDLAPFLRRLVAGPSRQSTSRPSPYPGLRSFAFQEAANFFGRSEEIDAIIARLRDPAHGLITVIGASGTGKSSLIHAGVLPRLATGAVDGSNLWPTLTFAPSAVGGDPFMALAVRIENALPPAMGERPTSIAKKLENAPAAILDYATMLLATLPENAAVVLFADQLEELFSSVDGKHRSGFITVLARAVTGNRIRVLATLRSDFLPTIMAESEFAPLLQMPGAIYPLGPLGPAALVDIIRKPAEQAGVEIDTGFVDEILREAGTGDGILPLIAFFLAELFEKSVSTNRITLEAYHALGGLRGAIGRRARPIIDEFHRIYGANYATSLPQLFNALVQVDAAGTASRRPEFRDVLDDMPAPTGLLAEELTNARLLTADNAEGRAVVMLAHEALIGEWPDLNEWVAGNRPRLQRIHRVWSNYAAAEPEDRLHAVRALPTLGIDPSKLVPPLIESLRKDPDERVRRAAAASLGEVGAPATEAIPALMEALNGNDLESRRYACSSLGSLGRAAADAVPALISALNDPDRDLQYRVLVSLAKIGTQAAPAVQILIDKFHNFDDVGRQQAAAALGQIGPAAASAIPILVDMLDDADVGNRTAADDALVRIGPAVIPSLIQALPGHGDAFRRRAASIAGRMGPAAAQQLTDALGRHTARRSYHPLRGGRETDQPRDRRGATLWAVNIAAASALANIGAAAEPGLVSALRSGSPEVRFWAAYALRKLGATAQAFPTLIAAVRGECELPLKHRAAAVQSLGRARPRNDKMISALIAVLGDSDSRIRRSAIGALRAVGAAAIPALTATLGDSNCDILRASAAEVLGRIGAASAGAVPALVLLLDDRKTREQAIWALGRIGPAAAIAVPPLISALSDPEVYSRAAAALGRMGPVAAEAVPSLIAAFFKDRDGWSAASALAQMGSAASQAVPELVAAITDKSHGYWRGEIAGYVLSWMGPAAAAAVRPLVAVLLDPSAADGWEASSALGHMGEVAVEAVPALTAALRHNDLEIRRRAVRVLGQLGGVAVEAVPELIAILTNTGSKVTVTVEQRTEFSLRKEVELRREAARALGRIGPAASEVLPALIALIGGDNMWVSRSAIEALGDIGHDAVQAARPLAAALSHRDEFIRRAAARTLEKIRAVEAVPDLISAVRNHDSGISASAAQALGRIGAAASRALPDLNAAAQCENESVKRSAAKAIKRITTALATSQRKLQ
jgi:HEAT repeat protein